MARRKAEGDWNRSLIEGTQFGFRKGRRQVAFLFAFEASGPVRCSFPVMPTQPVPDSSGQLGDSLPVADSLCRVERVLAGVAVAVRRAANGGGAGVRLRKPG